MTRGQWRAVPTLVAVYLALTQEIRTLTEQAMSTGNAETQARAFGDVEAKLLAFREQYPGTPEANDAAFQLGTMSFGTQRHEQAYQYLVEYLAKADESQHDQVGYARFYLAEVYRAQAKDGTAPPTEAARILERGKLRLDPERHTCHWDNRPVTLTVTEFLILQALATRPGVVKTRDALMDAAYDDQVYVDDRTIDSHIKRLRKKFKQVDDDFDVIETLYGVGYRFKET